MSRSNRISILSLLEYSSGSVYLDLGCGDEKLTLDVSERIGTSNITGIDLIEKKSSRILRVRESLESKFPFAPESFDVVTGSQVIEHISNTDNFIREIFRVLRPGGYTILSTPNLASIHIILMLLANRQPITCSISDKIESKWMGEGPRHRRLFTMEGLTKLLRFYGFLIEETRYSGYFPIPIISSIDKWHSNCITVKARKANV